MPHYLDDAQREEIKRLRAGFMGPTEWPTWLLLIGVYAGWPTLLIASLHLGMWPTTLLMIPLLVLRMSVQHEVLHGHPTRSLPLNKVLGYAPFAVWWPVTRNSFVATASILSTARNIPTFETPCLKPYA